MTKITHHPEWALLKALSNTNPSQIISPANLFDPRFEPVIHVCFIIQMEDSCVRYEGLYFENGTFRFNAANGVTSATRNAILFKLGLKTIKICLGHDENMTYLRRYLNDEDRAAMAARFRDDYRVANENQCLWSHHV